MQFKPVDVEGDNVNVGKEGLGREILVVGGWTIAFLVILYILAGFAVDVAAEHITPEQEYRWWSAVDNGEELPDDWKASPLLDSLMAQIPANILPQGYPLRLYIMEGKDAPNAFAVPGGQIVFTEGMMNLTENNREELLFILGHEIGHFLNRDHLKSMGRSLIVSTIVALFTGESDVGRHLGSFSDTIGGHYSRKQEYAADEMGLKILMSVTGSPEGAYRFMSKMQEEVDDGLLVLLSNTHPMTGSRLERLKKMAKDIPAGRPL